MRVEKDFKEFIESLNRNDVRYLIVGSFALSYYAEPRYTKDIDILIDSSASNAERLMTAIREFGFSDIELKTRDFEEKLSRAIPLQLFDPPAHLRDVF